MYPRDDGLPTFKYPVGRLLPHRDMISEGLMRAPDMYDHNDEPCLLLIKSGNATGVTIGRGTGIESYVRDMHTGETSKEWAVYNYDSKSGVFSAPAPWLLTASVVWAACSTAALARLRCRTSPT